MSSRTKRGGEGRGTDVLEEEKQTVTDEARVTWYDS